MNRETELRARVAELEAADRPFREVREAVAALAAEVARRVRREATADARRGANGPIALSVCLETPQPPQGPDIAPNGKTTGD